MAKIIDGKYCLSWEDVEAGCKRIAHLLKDKQIDLIIPLVRGGLTPGVLLSEMLNVKDVDPMKISTRAGLAFWPDREKWQVWLNTNVNVLVIDDIVDSGKTFDMLMGSAKHAQCPSNVYLASLVINTNAVPKHFDLGNVIHYLSVSKDENEFPWVVFPWDCQ